MRKSVFFGAAVAGFAGLFLAAPVANAGISPYLKFDHTTVVAGQTIKGEARCAYGPEGIKKAPLLSPALESEQALDKPGEMYFVSGTVKVKKDIKPGTYPASFECGDDVVVTKLTVVAKDDKTKPANKPTEQPKPAGQVAVKPKGAADTGEGDVQVAAPAQQSSGLGTGAYVIGGAALLAVSGGAFTIRKLRKQG